MDATTEMARHRFHGPRPAPKGLAPMPEQGTKRCTKCGETKALEAFSRSKRHRQGRQAHCRACMAVKVTRWAAEHPERVAAAQRRSKARYPEKRKARDAVKNALRDGKLARPERCSRCGTRCEPHAHHHDYSLLLVVEWLCRDCHESVHHDEEEAA